MAVENQSLLLDLVEWIAVKPRPYDEVMEAWRSSCPRLTIWEDALDQGLLRREADKAVGTLVMVTESGEDFLRYAGRLPEAGV